MSNEYSSAPTPQNRNALTVACDYNRGGKLQSKIERLAGNADEYAYAFDSDGRLAEVRLNGKLLEAYRYNGIGQRILQVCRHGGLREAERQFRYKGGRLAQAGRTEFYYDRNGALGQRCDTGGSTFFEYGNGSRLDKVHRRDGWEIRYEYGPYNPQPVRRFRAGRLTHEYHWLDHSRLSVCRDHNNDIEYQFLYDADGKLDRLRLVNLRHIDPQANAGMWGDPKPAGDAWGNSGPSGNAWGNSGSNQPADARKDPYGLLENCTFADSRPNTFMDWLCEEMARNNRKSPRSLFDESYAPREFLCCVDQVGTLRALVAANGAVIKEIRRDSFGIPYYDSFPDFHLPIGFAGGLEDPDTGLVRFGWRDYDPKIGRFTALDPARDRRGDGDLYDYCMDDPVSRVDPTGLWSKENFDESKVSRDPEGKFAPTGAGSGSGGGGGGGDASLEPREMGEAHGNNYFPGSGMPGPEQWRNPQNAGDNEYFPGTRMRKQTMRQTWQQHRDLYEEPELTFAEALVTGLGNIPESGITFVNDLCDALLSPIETGKGLGNIIAGYGCQIFGIESESRLYSDAVTEYYRKRYGSYAAFKKHLADDPVGLAADLSIVLTAGASAVRGLAKAGATASRVLPAGAAAQNVGKVLEAMEKAAAGMKTVGTKIDPLYLPGKYMGKAVGRPEIRESLPGWLRDNLSTIGTGASRAKTIVGVGGTQQAINREQEKKNK